MDNFKALPSRSQSVDDVLYFDASLPATELYECATYRMETARELLDSLSMCTGPSSEHAMVHVAAAAAMLLSDAKGILEAVYPVLNAHARMMEGVPPAAGVRSIFRARSEELDGVN